MTQDPHQHARELIACAGAEKPQPVQPDWLKNHLADCASCRDYADAARQLVSSLRSLAIAADPSLVRNTQLQVRLRAAQLQQQRERLLLVWSCCSLITLFAIVTSAALWPGFQWLRDWIQVSNLVWEIGYVTFWIGPAIAASILLFARGTHLAVRNGSSHQA